MRKVLATFMAGALLATSVAMAPAAEARHRRHHNNNNHGEAAAAAILGLAVGALIANSANSGYTTRTYSRTYYPPSYYGNGYNGYAPNGAYYSQSAGSHQQRCAMRYRSYDPYSDTFVGYDGRRYYCQL
jgi:hypothetical protein